MKQKGSLKKHNRLLSSLEARVREKFPDHKVYTEYEYNRGEGKRGELDLLRISPSGTWHYYEVKSCLRWKKKAREQYARVQYAFPEQNIKGIYVCPKYAERMR